MKPRRRTTELLRDALEAHETDRISLEALLDPLRSRAYGFVLLLLAVPNFIPVPIGIGGVMGVLVVALGLEMLFGLEYPWIPRWLRARTMSRAALGRFLNRIEPLTRRLEKLCKPRMERLTRRPLTIASGLVMILIGILLALPIPFTNYVFGAMLLAFAIALVERDGVLLLLVWIATAVVLTVSATFSHALVDLFHRFF
ncbi:MAG TPA: exopolysaccharide biosynthesis protein [Luteibacter sp.]|jgi:hypothetical protein|nr:exopolysaccharide biosynthesis protein [Luteibacter sp.]